ncbi:MAG TPA: DUF1257 domain-containing protein [Terriglobia bacterium]|nr:DUF1257 domain-containing protein [Terriglobia bacterium]
MSKYCQIETVLRDERYLVDALRDMGYKPEVHDEGATLNSYYSEQEGKVAHVIIRRRELPGAFGDIGFVRQADGQLSKIGDELDYQYGARWLGHVQQLYKEKQTLAAARAKGYILKKREVIKTSSGQQVRLEFSVRR